MKNEQNKLQDIADNIIEIVQDCTDASDIAYTIESVEEYLSQQALTTQQKQAVFAKYWQHAQNDDWATLKEIKAIAAALEMQMIIDFTQV